MKSTDISCSSCQALCCRLEVPLIDDSDDQVPEELTQRDPRGGTMMRQAEDGWCIAVNRNTFQCTIYSKRPWLCRDYAVASDDCLIEREKFFGH